jgi:hypothetical protein
MWKLLLTIALFIPFASVAKSERGAFGIEAGTAYLSDNNNSLIGSSWLFHAEFKVDQFLGFFGQAGNSSGTNDEKKLSQTFFNSGLLFDAFEAIELRLGLSSTFQEIDDGDSVETRNELGPLVGLSVYTNTNYWKIGVSGTAVQTGSMQSTALRIFVLTTF